MNLARTVGVPALACHVDETAGGCLYFYNRSTKQLFRTFIFSIKMLEQLLRSTVFNVWLAASATNTTLRGLFTMHIRRLQSGPWSAFQFPAWPLGCCGSSLHNHLFLRPKHHLRLRIYPIYVSEPNFCDLRIMVLDATSLMLRLLVWTASKAL